MRYAIAIQTFAAAALLACGDDGPGGTGDTGTDDAEAVDASSDVADDAIELDVADAGDDAEGSADAVDAADGSGEPDAPPTFEQCWDDLEPGEVEVFYDGFANSEGITFSPAGTMFVSSEDAVWAFDADGNRSPFAAVPNALGMTTVADGLIVADIGASNAPGVNDGAVYHVAWDGAVTRLADGIDSPNFVVPLADGDVLVSDDFDTTIWRVGRDGAAELVIDDVPSPNGMGYSPDGDTLYVVSTFTSRGEVWAFEVDDNGLPTGERTELARLGNGATNDGLAVDLLGRVYVAANIRNRIERVDPATGEVVVVADELGTPASLAFGRGPGFDPCSIYSTQLFGSKVLRVAIGVPGAPLIVGSDVPEWAGRACSTFEENACDGEGLCLRTDPLDCSVGHTGVCTTLPPACPPVDESEGLCNCDAAVFSSICEARRDGELEFVAPCEPDGSGEGSADGSGTE